MRERCPKCGSDELIQISYGLPTTKAVERANKGEIILGGCVVSEDSPLWCCNKCKYRFGAISV